jgi:hypothetical protein
MYFLVMALGVLEQQLVKPIMKYVELVLLLEHLLLVRKKIHMFIKIIEFFDFLKYSYSNS